MRVTKTIWLREQGQGLNTQRAETKVKQIRAVTGRQAQTRKIKVVFYKKMFCESEFKIKQETHE